MAAWVTRMSRGLGMMEGGLRSEVKYSELRDAAFYLESEAMTKRAIVRLICSES